MTRIGVAVRNAAKCLQIERSVGAPWPMVRFYIKMEVRHGLRGHEADAQDCARCYAAGTWW